MQASLSTLSRAVLAIEGVAGAECGKVGVKLEKESQSQRDASRVILAVIWDRLAIEKELHNNSSFPYLRTESTQERKDYSNTQFLAIEDPPKIGCSKTLVNQNAKFCLRFSRNDLRYLAKETNCQLM